MQKLIYLFSFFATLLLINCSSPKQFEAGRPRFIIRGDTSAKDSIIVYETEIEGRQRSDFYKMLGTWEVTTMRRQQKAALETLSNVHFELKADSAFTGRGGCNNMDGKFSVKGSSIKFGPIISTKMACDNMDKENAFFTLLENRISEYTFKGDELLLRDGASNIVFECKRK
jgi:heat shock protein HslJ